MKDYAEALRQKFLNGVKPPKPTIKDVIRASIKRDAEREVWRHIAKEV